jgi:ComF family protein
MWLKTSTPLRNWTNTGLNFFYPAVCQICGEQRATSHEGYVCTNCWTDVRFIMPPFCERCGLPYEGEISGAFECGNCREMELHFRFARSAVVAKGVVLDVIHRYKYFRALWFEPFLADLLIRHAKPVLEKEKWDWIVPIPLHRLKRREREFNQAERLADQLSRATNIPVNGTLIERVEFTRTQTQLTRPQRMENVRRAFRMRDGKRLDGGRIILLDDVLTTGATTSACAKILKQAGAEDICVWTVARGL